MLRPSVGATILLLCSVSVARGQSCSSWTDLQTLLMQVETSLSNENLTSAVDHLEDALACVELLREDPHPPPPPPSVALEERMHWDLAQVLLDKANQGGIHDQERAFFAHRSYEAWKEYVEWYQNVSAAQLDTIAAQSRQLRINLAVRQLGHALERRGNLGDYSIGILFDEYILIDPAWFSHQSVMKWRHWLHRCPTWAENPNETFAQLAVRLQEESGGCLENWQDFRDFLSVYVDVAELNAVNRLRFERWAQQLSGALEPING